MKSRLTIVVLIASLAINGLLLWAALDRPAPALAQDHTNELAPYMGNMQRYVHKLGLAVDAKNQALADFYIFEIEEVVTELQQFDNYEGFQIAALSKAMLAQFVTALDKKVEAADWAGSEAAFAQVVTACNSCHLATQRPYIKIVASKSNPFNQDFSK